MAGGTVLIADDDSAIRTVLNQAFARAGYAPRATGNAATLWRWVAQGEGDVVITDVVMPDENAFDLIPRIKKLRPDLPIIVMSAQNTLMTALSAAEKGAFEYLPKPFDLEPDRRPSSAARWPSPASARRRPPSRREAEELPLIGRSPAMQEIYRVLARLTRTDLTVMITGESGTGKELVAARAARLLQAPQRPVRRHQHGGHPARADRERAVRPREGRLHRRPGAHRGPLPAGRGRHAVPRRDRRHADGGADPAAARAAGGRVHHRRRPHADQDRRAHHRRHPPRAEDADPAGPVPRGPVLPPQRRAAAPAAAARAPGGHRRPRAPLPARRPPRPASATRPSRRRPSSASSTTTGPATCASWRTWCAASAPCIRKTR